MKPEASTFVLRGDVPVPLTNHIVDLTEPKPVRAGSYWLVEADHGHASLPSSSYITVA